MRVEFRMKQKDRLHSGLASGSSLPTRPHPRHLQSGFANCSPGPTALTPLGEARPAPSTISLEQG